MDEFPSYFDSFHRKSPETTMNARDILQQAEERLVVATAEVERLQREVAVRKAATAPIWSLPVEIMAMIFLECSYLNWKSPLILRAVCRKWHSLVGETKRAWSRLEITHATPLRFIKFWFQHYVSISGSIHQSQPKPSNFPNLEVLRIGRLNRATQVGKEKKAARDQKKVLYILRHHTESDSSLLNSIRFPRLTVLQLHGPPAALLRQVAKTPFFPPLQELHITVGDSCWREIIAHAAGGLVKLTLWISEDYRLPSALPILLRKLTHLFIYSVPIKSPPLRNRFYHGFYLRTPSLQSYHQRGRVHAKRILHADVCTVRSACLEALPHADLSKFDALENLVLLVTRDTLDTPLYIRELVQNPRICMFLDKIEFHVSGNNPLADGWKRNLVHAEGQLKTKRSLVVEVALAGDISGPHEFATYCTCGGNEGSGDRFRENT
ncbi:hypothetical protein FRC20_003261 [Serendipita sp. 405]|nr:hypothetical protein FRC15_003546 [Serendipita sp. 397]KAG8845297.1 hypothetical protein FRC20_003261 [Serendipita sp. 405]